MLLSIVSPAYNEEECLEEFRGKLLSVLEGLNCDFEVILVNDGSKDRTAELIDSFHREDSHFRGIHFARNFGHQAALTAGLQASRGDVVVLMDCDLQDDPKAIWKMLSLWKEGNEVVYAVRKNRKESLLRRTCYFLFYRVYQALSDVSVPLDSGDFSLLDRKVVDAMNSLPEKSRFLRGLRSWVGFRQVGLPVERQKRAGGFTKYTFRKMFSLAGDGLFSFSWVPLRAVTILGFLFFIISLIYLTIILFLRLTSSFELPGWTTVIFLVICFGGLQLVALGIIGEYIGRIFSETKQRPSYIIARSTDLP